MTTATTKGINQAKRLLVSNGRKFAGFVIRDCYGDEEYPAGSRGARSAIESAEEVCGISEIFPNFLDQIVIKLK